MTTMNRSLTVTWDDPHAAFASGKALAGIDYMKEMIAGRIAPPPIMRLMGFRLAQVGEGLAVFECEPGEQHYNPIGVVHAAACTRACRRASATPRSRPR